jgi:hypothetical protein
MCGERRDVADGAVALNTKNGHDREIDAQSPCPAPVTIGVPAFLVPKSLGEVKELAKLIALAEWAPDCYRDLDGNYLQPKIELAILHGATVGLGPIAAVHAIAVIGGTTSIWGDGALSVIEHSGLLEDMVEAYEVDDDEGLTAICSMKRRDRATPIVTRFSTAMAERAGLTRSEGPWQTYPERMLRMRARSWTMRDGFADVLRGLQLREEVEDYVGNRGGRLGHAPHRDVSSQGSPHHYSSPRPSRPSGANGAGRPNDRPTATVLSPRGHREDRPLADTPLPVGELYTLVDADGGFIEVTGPDALRAGFERLFLDKHLSPDQIAGVWESNELARQMIERLFGPAALTQAQEHLRSIESMRNLPNDAQLEPTAPSSTDPARNEDSRPDHPSEPNQALVLEINPIWGIQKIFQRYRAALSVLDDDSAHGKPAIARFREANIDVEQRLRAKLSSRMGPIDAIYQRVGLDA